ncbi:MAG: DUF4019 domain-containing protein [Candidatus Sulfobium sp.]
MKKIVAAVVLAGVLMAGVSSAINSDKEKAAVAVAEKWLALVDAGKYSESWSEAAEYFRNAVTQDQWQQKLRAVRTPLGKVISRKLKTAAFRSQLPGAPDGQYVVIQFKTSFRNKRSAIETVTPMLENGIWKVSGYYIK